MDPEGLHQPLTPPAVPRVATRTAFDPALLALCACPACAGSLAEAEAGAARCVGCGAHFPSVGGIPCLFVDSRAKVALWDRQLAHYLALVERSLAATQQQLSQFAMLPATRGRLERLLVANQKNAERIAALFRCAGLAGERSSHPASTRGAMPVVAAADESALELVSYYNHVLRDWSADPEAAAENADALRLVLEALGDERGLGRVLVVGAGACRLAFDLAAECDATTTVALDMSPFLLLAARAIILGDGLRLHEIPEAPRGLASVCVEHELRARSTPPGLHFVLGDALTAPFRAGSFDTVVTPWFVDVADADVRETMSVVHRLLRDGGRWVNLGPLEYPAQRPAMQRYTPEEFFDLAERAGFAVLSHRTATIELLRSAASARRRGARALVSIARKGAAPSDAPDGVPPWLLFSHVPIPPFAGLDAASAEPMVAYLSRVIDGKRTLRDVADRMIADHGARPDAALDGTRALLTAIYQTYETGPIDPGFDPETAAPM
jgi:uncharacterized protein YbaR (Trm112 family)